MQPPPPPPPPPPPRQRVDFWSDLDPAFNNTWFSTPFLIVMDTIRVCIILGSLWYVFLTARAIFAAPTKTQRALLISNIFYGMLGIVITYARLGDPVTMRFLLVVGGVAFGVWGSWYYNFGPNRFPGRHHVDRS